MCGIFSLLNYSETGIGHFCLETFLKGKRRGPESSNLIEAANKCKMGFHRLAICSADKTSNQPLQHQNCILICNGEIYNYEHLFKLINETPNTTSDCEIIIHLYKKYGIVETLKLLDGVFAFVLLDQTQNNIYIARDTFGVRPLFTLYDQTLYGFSSEMKSLIDISTISEIKPFMPGTWSKFSYKKTSFFSPRWQPIIQQESFSKIGNDINYTLTNKPDVLKLIQTTLMSAVEKRVNTGSRPIACLLSGGLDSSLITALVKYYLKDVELETYSIGIKGSEDLKYAKIAADYIGTKHTQIEFSEKEFLDAIPETIQAIESYDTTTVRASVGNYLVSKYISENSEAKIIFNGDGSDEVCGGYMYFHLAPDSIEFDIECKRLLRDIHYFDVLRSDRSISSNGLEARTPFLDKTFVSNYLSINPELRSHAEQKKCEKYLLREAFAPLNLLPKEILWRKKEAFSDGVSPERKSWFEVIAEYVKTDPIQRFIKQPFFRPEVVGGCVYIDPQAERMQMVPGFNMPQTDEQIYYRKLFHKFFNYHSNVIPYFWMPKFIDATDSSARTLKIYNTK